VGGVGGSFQAQRIKGRDNHGNSIGIGIVIGLRVYAKPWKVLRFTSLLQGRG
jgi:hypothetical protein